MLAVALALAASMLWGVGDFLGGLKSRTLPLLGVLICSQAVGFATQHGLMVPDDGSETHHCLGVKPPTMVID